MKQRYCPYGSHFVDDVGFKFVFHAASNTTRGMCPICAARRRQPRAALQALADQERAARRDSSARLAREAAANKGKEQ